MMLGPIVEPANPDWCTIEGLYDQGSPKMPNIADIIHHQVSLSVSCLDRLYLHHIGRTGHQKLWYARPQSFHA